MHVHHSEVVKKLFKIYNFYISKFISLLLSHSLVEGGQTALGPSLLMSTAIASQRAGSKVIICTDGKANVGLGNLDAGNDDETYGKSVEFYDELGDYARDAG